MKSRIAEFVDCLRAVRELVIHQSAERRVVREISVRRRQRDDKIRHEAKPIVQLQLNAGILPCCPACWVSPRYDRAHLPHVLPVGPQDPPIGH
jgi:hypothetical protein